MNNSLRGNPRFGRIRLRASAVVVSAALLGVACGERETPAPPTPEVTANDVRQETSEARDSAGAYAVREKDEFVTAARREMDQLRTEIARLRERAGTASGGAREELRQEIDEMDAKWRDADLTLERLKTESSEAWREMKEGFSAAMAELKQSYREAREEFDRS